MAVSGTLVMNSAHTGAAWRLSAVSPQGARQKSAHVIFGACSPPVDTVTIRELRNRGGEVVDCVAAGGYVTVTRDGRAVAELRPMRPRGLSAVALLERWRRLLVVDPARLRRDLDSLIEPDL